MEGVDPASALRALAGTQLKWTHKRGAKVAFEGQKDLFARRFSAHLKNPLTDLRKDRDPYEVARLTGLTQREQALALGNTGDPHNWTLGQLVRLARACGLDPEDMLIEVLQKIKKEGGLGF